MSGILEQILAELQKHTALMQSGTQTLAAGAVTNGSGAAAPVVHDPFAAAAPAAAPQQITEAHVMSLIEPHLDNAPLKAALSGVLAQMGIARLPEARPDQYAALYTAFQGIIAQHAAAPAAAPVGII